MSDGLETCNADPCAAAAELKKSGVDFTVHVVGFGTTAEENRQFSCIADSTGGKFLGAKDAPELKAAMTKTVELVAKPEPVAATTSSAIFSDSFDGNALGRQWEIMNEDKDGYIVENGALQILTSRRGDLLTSPNSLRLNDANLDGDWDMSVTFRPEFSTGYDQIQIGVVDGEKNVPIRAAVYREGDSGCQKLALLIAKNDTQPAVQEKDIMGNCSSTGEKVDDFNGTMQSFTAKGATLTLSRRGRNYTAQFTAPMRKPVTAAPLTLLRLNGRPSFVVNKFGAGTEQTSALIDEFRITGVK